MQERKGDWTQRCQAKRKHEKKDTTKLGRTEERLRGYKEGRKNAKTKKIKDDV